jgi:predicted site-specific integrase-resolvase
VPSKAKTLYDSKQLAALLQVNPRTITQWARKQSIPAICIAERTYRFDLEDVSKALGYDLTRLVNRG